MIRVAQHAALEYQYVALLAENEDLRRQNDDFRANYDRLHGRVAYIADMSESLAREVNHQPITEVDQQVGMGGPAFPDNIDIPEIDRQTEDLERQLRELSNAYRDEQSRLATTPSGWPVRGYLTDSFGVRSNPFGGGGVEGHEGQDIAAPFGAPVTATADGMVVYAAARSGYGNVVVIYHGNGLTTRYGHLSQIGVETGQRIRRGDEIGKVGSTGRSTGPHCHYEVRQNGVPHDPMPYIGG
jgi:murein DD-endopeptidase MepM/ murein hydrolase activator NlpD